MQNLVELQSLQKNELAEKKSTSQKVKNKKKRKYVVPISAKAMANSVLVSSKIGSEKKSFLEISKNSSLKKIIHFKEMEYEQLTSLFHMHSPHLVPIIKRIDGYLNKQVIVCNKHNTPLIVVKNEKLPCLKCE